MEGAGRHDDLYAFVVDVGLRVFYYSSLLVLSCSFFFFGLFVRPPPLILENRRKWRIPLDTVSSQVKQKIFVVRSFVLREEMEESRLLDWQRQARRKNPEKRLRVMGYFVALIGTGFIIALNSGDPPLKVRTMELQSSSVLPESLERTLQFGVSNLTRAVELCAEFDDDGSYPSETCDCSDLHWECELEMPKSPLYASYCQNASCSSSCQGDDQSWANVCAWQMIADLPGTCNGTFEPELPDWPARDLPNHYPDLDYTQRLKLGYSERMGGPCAFHSFCYTCLDDAFPHGVNPFCAYVYLNYGGTPTHTNFFNEIESQICPNLDDILRRNITNVTEGGVNETNSTYYSNATAPCDDDDDDTSNNSPSSPIEKRK